MLTFSKYILSGYEVFLSFLLAMSAWVFVNILQSEDMIFEKYPKLLEKLPQWLSKPLGGCDLCFAGQLGFWGYFINCYFQAHTYNLISHIFFTLLTVFFIKVIDKLILIR